MTYQQTNFQFPTVETKAPWANLRKEDGYKELGQIKW